ncbi:MAG: T9SS type A sorting domain-containing protein, partial [Ignavibacteria bacterium]|nr:T9SS type A sorting domain-containing protein [Ignavibacteria bacterium]
EIVWLYINPVIATGPMTQGDPIPTQQNRVFRSYRYAHDYPGFVGKDLTPGDPIEIIISSIEESSNDLNPTEFKIFQNFPNPFNPSTKIKYALPKNAFVNLTVYNVLGKTVTTLVNEEKRAGNYEIIFYASEIPSGIYFYRLTTNDFISTKKMILVK